MNKILSFIINDKNEFLSLLGSDKDPQFKNLFGMLLLEDVKMKIHP